MKTRGRAAAADVPPSHLGGSASGLAAWAATPPTSATHLARRRHFHATSQIAQTTAWDCLPCVDDAAHPHTPAAAAPAEQGASSGSGHGPDVSLSLARGNREWRRHRRQVPAPPCTDRPQGKRMLHTAVPPCTCKELLQDPQPLPARTRRTGSQHVPAYSSAKVSAVAGQPEKPGQSEKDCGQRRSSRIVTSRFSISSGGLSSKAAPPGQLASSGEAATGVLMHASIGSAATAATASSSTKKKAGRVEDDPSFFRT